MKVIGFFLILLSCAYFLIPQDQKIHRKVSAISKHITGDECAFKLLQIKSKSDDEAIKNAFSQCLSDYIQIKTISPKGDEHLAVAFFEEIFSKLSIPHRKFFGPDLSTAKQNERVSFIASLNEKRDLNYDWRKKTKRKSILMLNHMDVVDANLQQWEDPGLAWSGDIKSDKSGKLFIWGRGALDMKGIAVTQLISMWLLKISDQPLKRDVHFLAVADEESGGSGAITSLQLSEEGKELHALSNVEVILNEGGGAIRDTPKDGVNLVLISSEEKGGAWMEFSHPHITKLLSNLYTTKMVDLNKYISKDSPRFRGHDCEIQTIETPKSKVNVVASVVNLTLKCRAGFQTEFLFRSVFEKKFKTVKAEIKQTGEITKLKISTESASHGSTGINESAIDALMVGLYHLGLFEINYKKKNPRYFRYILTPATRLMIKGLGESERIVNIVRHLNFIPFIKNLILKEVENSFGVDGLFRTSCQVSAINHNETKSSSLVDCRLLHTANGVPYGESHAKSFIKEIKKVLGDNQNEIKLISGWDVSQSPVQSHDFNLIIKTLEEEKKVIAVPYMFPAGTDSTWFRNPYSANVEHLKPIPSYGFFPLYMSDDLLATYHGSDERFPLDEILPTVSTYSKVVKRLAKSPGGSLLKRAVNSFRDLKEVENNQEVPPVDSNLLGKEIIEYYNNEIQLRY